MASIGRYELLAELGRGGYGVVYRARSGEGEVALKLLLRPDARDALARFERERRLLASLAEEGFVPLLDAGDSPRGPFYVMPFLEGGTLRARLERGALPVEEAVELALELARSLGRAHARGIVHRDLKPENVLFDAGGRPLVSDLGLAKHFRRDLPGASQSLSLTSAGEMKGTLGYMAPEQLDSAKDAGPAVDVFALGAILYECLAGRPAFQGATASELGARLALGEFEPLRRVRPETPRWLENVVVQALAVDPAKRPPDATAFARVLRARPRGGAAKIVLVTLALVVAGATIAWRLAPAPAAPKPPPAPPPPPPPPAPRLKILRELPLPAKVPAERLSVDFETRRIVLGDSMGQDTTVVLDLDGVEQKRLTLAGGFVDPGTHRIYGSATHAGQTFAYDARTLEETWAAIVRPYWGGVFDIDPRTGLLYEVFQNGGQHDPLIVFDAKNGDRASGEIRPPRVATNVVVNRKTGRAYVSTQNRELHVHAPFPGFALEKQHLGYDALGADAQGRVYASDGDGHLCVIEADGDPVATRQPAGPLVAGASRLYVGLPESIRALALDATRELARVSVAGKPLRLALGGEGRLYVLVEDGSVRSLLVIDPGP